MMDQQRFLTHVEKMPSGCWHWTAAKRGKKSGYGQAKHNGKIHYAHRLSFQLFKGEIPTGYKVLHHCDNRICVNPDHLRCGSQQENIVECAQKGRLVNNAGERHGLAKLTADQVLKIRASGERPCDLGRRFGINESTVRSILARKLWKHI